ncbi:hypothetical protein [Paenibacillus polymyxa]|uniref:Uncharacterized protein n=1 Tax=Paenibacillus polymyxa TaxID=1406 RepID=A0AAP4A4F8_PAEPO|nr:hypothetical protein [Paenibacillus polymyxa]MDH2332474.1 hypothetical protein [Paenibacillus polymyxa]
MNRTFTEEAAEFKSACRTLVIAVSYSLKLDKLADWFAKKLTKE